MIKFKPDNCLKDLRVIIADKPWPNRYNLSDPTQSVLYAPNQVSISPLVLQHDAKIARLLVRYNEARCGLATQPLPLVRGQWTEKSFQVISCRYFNISFHSAAARPARPARAAYSGGWAAAAQNREAGALTASHTQGDTHRRPGDQGTLVRGPGHPPTLPTPAGGRCEAGGGLERL